jgi:hypothetical protein
MKTIKNKKKSKRKSKRQIGGEDCSRKRNSVCGVSCGYWCVEGSNCEIIKKRFMGGYFKHNIPGENVATSVTTLNNQSKSVLSILDNNGSSRLVPAKDVLGNDISTDVDVSYVIEYFY